MEVVVETKRLLSLFRSVSLNELVPKTVLHFGESGVSVLNPGVGRQIVVKAWFSPNFFIDYNIDGEVKIGVNCEEIINLLKVIKDNKVTFSIDENNIYIRSQTVDVRVPQITIEEESVELEFFEAPFGEIVVRKFGTEEETKKHAEELIKKYAYTKIPVLPGTQLDPLKVDKIAFEIKDGRLFMVQENEVGVRFGRNISEVVNNPIDGLRVTVRVEFVKEIMKSVLSGEVYLAIGQRNDGRPLAVIFCDKTTDWRITVPVAPIVEEIEEESE